MISTLTHLAIVALIVFAPPVIVLVALPALIALIVVRGLKRSPVASTAAQEAPESTLSRP